MPFLDDLQRYGPRPDGSTPAVDRQDAWAYCDRLTRSHYENFSVVTWLTPRPLRPAFRSIYAFCRWSDDLGDEVGDRPRATALLAWWRDELRAMYAGATPRHPVMVALGETVREFAIPIEPFEALISAFEQDQVVTEYEDYDQLLDYCTRSANPVGHLVLYLGRAYDAENAALADRTCTGLQLANFWQDVARDLTIGRIYLPRADRARFGYRDADLHARRFTPEFAALLRFEVERARELLGAGRALVGRLPRGLAVDVDLFGRGGLAILDRIQAQGFDVWRRRPEVSKAAKLGLLMRALLARGKPIVPERRPGGRTSSPGRSRGGRRELRDGRRTDATGGQLRVLPRRLAARGEELLLQLLPAPRRPAAGDVRPLRLPPPDRRHRRRPRRGRREGRGPRSLARRPPPGARGPPRRLVARLARPGRDRRAARDPGVVSGRGDRRRRPRPRPPTVRHLRRPRRLLLPGGVGRRPELPAHLGVPLRRGRGPSGWPRRAGWRCN